MILLNKFQVIEKTGMSESTLRRRIADGGFPPPRQISRRKIGWLDNETDEWLINLPVVTGEQPEELKAELPANLRGRGGIGYD